MAQRQTLDLQSVKTRQIIYQNPDGTFPSAGGVLEMGDMRGHAAWTSNPSVDTITLATGGTLAYDGSDLLLNGVPVQSITSVTGGTNITVTDNSVNPIVNLDIKENLDMNNFSITSAQNVSISNNLYVGASTYSYSPFTNTAIMNSPYNIAISAGSTPISTGTISMITESDGVINSRVSDTGGVSHGYTHINKFGIFQVGSTNTTTDPSVRLQGMSVGSVASIKMYNATSILTVEGGASTTMKIAVPLRDVSSGTAGTAGQVLTSAGAGAPPYWGSGAILGRYWTSVSGEITVGPTLFPALADLSGVVRIRVDLMGGGGGGGGAGSNSIVGAGSGGGGGQGFNKSGVITHTIGDTLYFEVGSGGKGGDGSLLLDPPTNGVDGEPSKIRTSSSGRVLATANGGKGGGSGLAGAGIGGDGFASGEDGVAAVADGGTGGGYYGGTGSLASILNGTINGGINGDYTSGTGCGGGGGLRTNTIGSAGGTGDRGYCLIEILEVV